MPENRAKMEKIGKTRFAVGLALLIIIPLGFATKFYHGPASAWVADSLSGVFYEVFWCLVIFWAFPWISPWKIAAIVFLFTAGLEFTQLLNWNLLLRIRETFLGRTLIGTTFRGSDFFYYFLGSGLGALLLTLIKKRGMK